MRAQPGTSLSCSAAEGLLLAELSALPSVPAAHRLAAGDQLFRAGMVIETVSIVRDGLVAVRRSMRGRQTTLMLLRRGNVIDDSPLLGPLRTGCDAVAVTDAEVLSVAIGQLWPMLHGSWRLARLWVLATACRCSAYQRRLLELQAGDIRAQVASLVLHETGVDGATALTHQMMAELLGVQRSSVSRVLSDLARRGVIRRGYGELRVRDRHALERIAGYPTTVTPLDNAG